MWSRPACDMCVWQLRVWFTPPANVWTITAVRKPSTVTGRSWVRFLGLKHVQREAQIIIWQQCTLHCGISVAFFPFFLSRLEKWSLGGNNTLGWKCSLEFEVIHVSVFDIEARLSPSVFTQTAKRRAAAGKYLPSFLLLCLLALGGRTF